MDLVNEKTRTYFKRLRKPRIKKDFILGSRTTTIGIVFDKITTSHDFVTNLIKKVDHKKYIRPVYMNGLTLSSIISPKRRVIQRIKDHSV